MALSKLKVLQRLLYRHNNLIFCCDCRQRDIIYRFFYPSTYQDFEATEPPKPGDRRTPRNLKFSALFDNGADLDLLYTKVGGIGAMQINTAVVNC